jgi:hypothetical protein
MIFLPIISALPQVLAKLVQVWPAPLFNLPLVFALALRLMDW